MRSPVEWNLVGVLAHYAEGSFHPFRLAHGLDADQIRLNYGLDHCGVCSVERRRGATFLLADRSDLIQVGSTCLHKLNGHRDIKESRRFTGKSAVAYYDDKTKGKRVDSQALAELNLRTGSWVIASPDLIGDETQVDSDGVWFERSIYLAGHDGKLRYGPELKGRHTDMRFYIARRLNALACEFGPSEVEAGIRAREFVTLVPHDVGEDPSDDGDPEG